MATIHGDNIMLDQIRAELYAQMSALKTAMVAANVSPRPAAIYDSHEQIFMSLPAISIGLIEVVIDAGDIGRSRAASGSLTKIYELTWDIRVHSDYRDGYLDGITVSRLLNSIMNWFAVYENLNLSELLYHEITELKTAESFEESLTIGGRLNLKLKIALQHTQA